jgi:hypothetical protein
MSELDSCTIKPTYSLTTHFSLDKIRQMPKEQLIVVFDNGPRSLGFNHVVGEMATHRFIHQIDEKLGDGVSCWRAASVERREGSLIEGRGLFATEDIEPGTLVAVKGGRIVPEKTVRQLTSEGILHGSQQQIDYDRFLVGLTVEEEDRNLVGYNHSCDPNAIVRIVYESDISLLVVNKPVKKGEEITADYSVSNVTSSHRFLCNCGAENCRMVVQPRYDYLHKDFQAAHMAEFPDHMLIFLGNVDNAPEEEKKELLGSAKVCELAGRIVVLGRGLQMTLRGEIDSNRSQEIQKAFASDMLLFVAMHDKGIDEGLGISRKNEVEFRKSVFENRRKIYEYAKRVDNEYNWDEGV